jgi:hypothetical protein
LLSPGQIAGLRQLPRALFEKHAGDIRQVLRELYDSFATGCENSAPWQF